MSGSATTYTWNTTSGNWGTGTSWTNATNQTTGAVPTSIDTAVLPDAASGSYTVTIPTGSNYATSETDLGASTGLDVFGTFATGDLVYTSSTANSTSVTVERSSVLDLSGSIDAPVAETINVAGGGHLELGSVSTYDPGVTFNFASSGGEIEYQSGYVNNLRDFQPITNFGNHDLIVFDGSNFTADNDTVSYANKTLTVKDGMTGNTVLRLQDVTLASGTTVSLTNDAIEAMCYAAGTRILTPTGEREVDLLVAGDSVLAMEAGELVAHPVKWVGRRRIELSTHPRPETICPVRIQRGAFAANQPHRDLVVSPDHAIFVDDKLIAARQLINGTTIRQELGWSVVDYFHVELGHHAILVAEGLAAESYLDTGNRGFFVNGGAVLQLHPDLTNESNCPLREAGSCQPFVWDAASVQPVWQRLADRAAALGQPVARPTVTTDADLRLLVKGRSVKPLSSENGRFIFVLPRGATEARLVSRAGTPTATKPWIEDRRSLGVYVERIVLRTQAELTQVALDDPTLHQGWWAVEHEAASMRRWTTGDALLPLHRLPGTEMLEVHLGEGDIQYVVAEDREAA